MKPPGSDTVVVRYGDMSTKSHQVRVYMERLLVDNLSALLSDRDVPGEVERRHSRPVIHPDELHGEAAAEAAADAFGVVSTSPALTVAPERDAIESALVDTALARYRGGSFAIDARRAGEHPFTSDDVERSGGSAVYEALERAGYDPEVDLDDPDLTVSVEVREDVAFVYVDRVPGPGGLPLGSQSRLVALISGGIDSPVAAYEVMCRGSPVIPVYVALGGFGGPDHRARAEEVTRRLAAFAPNFDTRLRVVDGGDTAEYLEDEMGAGRMLSLRRFMLRVAELVADRADADGVVTGEAVGQKSSQTTRNLRATEAAVDRPVHRPLLTADTNEIVERAKDVGTFRDSTIPAGCRQFVPSRPETNARLDRLRDAEPDDLFERAERAVEALTLVTPR